MVFTTLMVNTMICIRTCSINISIIFAISGIHMHAVSQCCSSGVTRSMVIPGPETEVIGESGSGGLGAVPPDAEKGLILHVLRIS